MTIEQTTLETIAELQMENGTAEMQAMIDNGSVWHMEGAMGREAMRLLNSGACMLPEESFTDYWGNKVPSRNELEDGSKGTLGNTIRYYELM